jgi:macrolide-specific efflux system membrane fusion protein
VGDNRYKVTLLRNGETREREVALGARNDTQVEVVKGLEEGDEVVIGRAAEGSAP